jgi:hypothetical protein
VVDSATARWPPRSAAIVTANQRGRPDRADDDPLAAMGAAELLALVANTAAEATRTTPLHLGASDELAAEEAVLVLPRVGDAVGFTSSSSHPNLLTIATVEQQRVGQARRPEPNHSLGRDRPGPLIAHLRRAPRPQATIAASNGSAAGRRPVPALRVTNLTGRALGVASGAKGKEGHAALQSHH